VQLIDTHQHLWDLSQFRYSWTETQPRLKRSFRLEDYQRATSGLDVLQTVHVEADVDEPFREAETRYILSLAERPETRIGGVVAALRPESKQFPAELERLAGHHALKGIRRLLQSAPDDLPSQPLFRQHVRLLASYGLSFDLCLQARQLPATVQLVSDCPDVSFILDHCANPEIRLGVSNLWRDQIAELASYPHVACKISGLVNNADWERWKAEDLRPAIEWVLACFGWDRVMFGSDWPVCTLASSFQRWVDALLLVVKGTSAENREKLFVRNAQQLYRLPPLPRP
jgi:predicted TIM-barrel fold metal-dependent hydrolase